MSGDRKRKFLEDDEELPKRLLSETDAMTKLWQIHVKECEIYRNVNPALHPNFEEVRKSFSGSNEEWENFWMLKREEMFTDKWDNTRKPYMNLKNSNSISLNSAAIDHSFCESENKVAPVLIPDKANTVNIKEIANATANKSFFDLKVFISNVLMYNKVSKKPSSEEEILKILIDVKAIQNESKFKRENPPRPNEKRFLKIAVLGHSWVNHLKTLNVFSGYENEFDYTYEIRYYCLPDSCFEDWLHNPPVLQNCASWNPDNVLIVLGAKSIYAGKPLPFIKADAEKFLVLLRRQMPKTTLIPLQIELRFFGSIDSTESELYRTRRNKFNSKHLKLLKMKDCTWTIGGLSRLDNRELYKPDGLNLNVLGLSRMMELIIKCIHYAYHNYRIIALGREETEFVPPPLMELTHSPGMFRPHIPLRFCPPPRQMPFGGPRMLQRPRFFH